MPEMTDPNQRRSSTATAHRALRQRLVVARLGRFPTRRAAAKALGWSVRKQDLLESADQKLGERDLPAIFDVLEIDEADQAIWLRLVDQTRTRGWWDEFTDSELPPGAKQWAALEWGARRIRTFTGTVVP